MKREDVCEEDAPLLLLRKGQLSYICCCSAKEELL
jgi:hypothetical protein